MAGMVAREEMQLCQAHGHCGNGWGSRSPMMAGGQRCRFMTCPECAESWRQRGGSDTIQTSGDWINVWFEMRCSRYTGQRYRMGEYRHTRSVSISRGIKATGSKHQCCGSTESALRCCNEQSGSTQPTRQSDPVYTNTQTPIQKLQMSAQSCSVSSSTVCLLSAGVRLSHGMYFRKVRIPTW